MESYRSTNRSSVKTLGHEVMIVRTRFILDKRGDEADRHKLDDENLVLTFEKNSEFALALTVTTTYLLRIGEHVFF